MTFDLNWLIVMIAFACEFIDSTLGMGYGTTLTPVLMLMGFEPLQIVPSILVSELITGVMAGVTHHWAGNVNFRPATCDGKRICRGIRKYGLIDSVRRGFPRHLKIALLIAACSVIGTIVAVIIAVNIPKYYLQLYIALLIIAIGLTIMLTLNKSFGFSWKKVVGLSLLASFNKGISGGGYGPVVTGGQLLSGIDVRNAVGITSLAEGITCLAGVITFVLTVDKVDFELAPFLIIGAILSVPLSAICVSKVPAKKLKIVVGLLSIVLGLVTLNKVL